ncbi:MAG: type I methionyl aminopeptidase [Candidatus Margulisbacteria bacterium GWF2_35_9]|nr:MAG: type I methionyl aminopeptidase [Candidatus Margulisbacteria bacterium GWF2_35_9]
MSREVNLRTDEEIEKIAAAGSIVAGFLDEEVKKYLTPGIKTIEIDNLATQYAFDHKGRPSFKDVPGYYHSLCISINEQIVHGIPGQRELKEGDLVKIDFGVTKDNYIGDACRSYIIGDATPDVKHLVEITEKCLYLGIEAAIIGNYIGDIGYAIQKLAEKNRFGVVREFVGHGVGTQLHEAPSVPHYGQRRTGIKLKEGMILAIEPMINMGTWRSKVLADGWTAVTMDGKWSAQFEHTIAITKNGPRILTKLNEVEK